MTVIVSIDYMDTWPKAILRLINIHRVDGGRPCILDGLDAKYIYFAWTTMTDIQPTRMYFINKSSSQIDMLAYAYTRSID